MSRLIGWWKGENNAIDSVNGYDATWVNDSGYGVGVSGNCFDIKEYYNGITWVDRYFYITNSNLIFDDSRLFTIEMYWKFEQTSINNQYPIVDVRNTYIFSGYKTWQVFYNKDQNRFELGNKTTTVYFNKSLLPITFYLIRIIHTLNTFKIFVDGVEVLPNTTGSLLFTPTEPPTYWNFFNSGVNYPKKSIYIDELKIYDDLLNELVIEEQIELPLYRRYDSTRRLNLTKFLPSMEQGTETQQFTQFIEDFYNTMFDGESGSLSVSASDISPVSGDFSLSAMSDIVYEYNNPISASVIVSASTNLIEQIQVTSIVSDTPDKISILEKVNRLVDLKDPELIDIEYIQYFASNLGYNVDVYRSEIGNVAETIGDRPSGTSADDVNDYLRFMVSNLPNWYKIKATDNAIKVMLYSFGLVGDLVDYYTENYLLVDDGGKWVADYAGDLSNIPKSYFCTPHFAIRIMVDESEDLIADIAKRESVIRAIKSIQPINTVFRNLTGNVDRDINMNMSMMTRLTRYMRITD